MNKIEVLIAEYGSLNFKFIDFMPPGISGLISNNTVYIDNTASFEVMLASLAEEIGHHETAYGDIIDQRKTKNRKLELKGREWSYKKLIPFNELKEFVDTKEVVHSYEIAEKFEVPESIVDDAIDLYRRKKYL